MSCFIDTMRPVTPAEIAGWRFFVKMPSDTMRGARVVFRRVHVGMSPGDAVLAFVADTGVTDAALLAELEAVLEELAAERKR